MAYVSRTRTTNRVSNFLLLREQLEARSISVAVQWAFASHFYEALVSEPPNGEHDNKIPSNYARKDVAVLVLHHAVYGYSALHYQRHFNVPHSSFCRLLHFTWARTKTFPSDYIKAGSFDKRQEASMEFFREGPFKGIWFWYLYLFAFRHCYYRFGWHPLSARSDFKKRGKISVLFLQAKEWRYEYAGKF
jgi:hypothetical protein